VQNQVCENQVGYSPWSVPPYQSVNQGWQYTKQTVNIQKYCKVERFSECTIPYACHMLSSVCHMLYCSNQSVTWDTTFMCLSHGIPLPSACHILYHSPLSVTYYTTPICLSHVIPLPFVCHMLYHSHVSVTCYTTPICLWHAIRWEMQAMEDALSRSQRHILVGQISGHVSKQCYNPVVSIQIFVP
jgi:hypothetical protein